MTLFLSLMLALLCVQLCSKMEQKVALGFSKLYFQSYFHSIACVKTHSFGWEGLRIRDEYAFLSAAYTLDLLKIAAKLQL